MLLGVRGLSGAVGRSFAASARASAQRSASTAAAATSAGRSSGGSVGSVGSTNGSAGARGAHVKHKVPQKRASALLGALRTEEYVRLRKAHDYSAVRPGDSVLVERLPFMSSNEPDKIKGLVIAKTNRASDSALILLNSEHGTPVKRRILMYSPLVQNITVLQKSFIHKGLKRVRRSKLYYLEERNADSFTVN